MAIYFRAGISLFSRFVSGILTPLLDAAAIYLGYFLFLPIWEREHFDNAGTYPPEYLNFIVPAYVVVWLFGIFITTGYEKKAKVADLARGVLTGTLIILVIYALLPENWRFSRALIILGTLWTLIATFSVRYLLHSLIRNVYSFEIFKRKKRIIIIGDSQESIRVYSIINQTHVVPELIGYVSPDENSTGDEFMGDLSQIEDIVRVNQADELIFCAASLSSEKIIHTMLQFTDTDIEFKIAPPESLSVIGSNSNESAGELYVLHFNTLSRLLNKRKKRLFDLVFSILLIPASIIVIFIVRNRGGYIRNIFSVLAGINSWVGYYRTTGGEHPGLPRIKPGILTPADLNGHQSNLEVQDEQINLSYAKDYRIKNDVKILINNLPLLGRMPAIDYA
jgi:hypothetical protein